MCGYVIINKLLEMSNCVMSDPEAVDTDEEFSCCRKKFKMKNISVRGENYGEV